MGATSLCTQHTWEPQEHSSLLSCSNCSPQCLFGCFYAGKDIHSTNSWRLASFLSVQDCCPTAPSFQRETQPAAMRYPRSCGLWSIPTIQAWSTNALFSDDTIFCCKILPNSHLFGTFWSVCAQPDPHNGSTKGTVNPEERRDEKEMRRDEPPGSSCRPPSSAESCTCDNDALRASFHQQRQHCLQGKLKHPPIPPTGNSKSTLRGMGQKLLNSARRLNPCSSGLGGASIEQPQASATQNFSCCWRREKEGGREEHGVPAQALPGIMSAITFNPFLTSV